MPSSKLIRQGQESFCKWLHADFEVLKLRGDWVGGVAGTWRVAVSLNRGDCLPEYCLGSGFVWVVLV